MADINALAGILAHFEGNGTTDVNGRAANPLNIEIGDIGYGTITAAGGNRITVFPDPDAGMAAGIAHLQSDLAGAGRGSGPYANVQTLGQFLRVWNGGNATAANAAAQQWGFSPDTPISQVQAAVGVQGVSTAVPPPDIAVTGQFDGLNPGPSSLPSWAPWLLLGVVGIALLAGLS